jgi:hypothetical protein
VCVWVVWVGREVAALPPDFALIFRPPASDRLEVSIFPILFLICLATGALTAFFGAALLAMAIRRRANSTLAVFCALPGVALLGVAVWAFRVAHLFIGAKIPPGG